MTAGPKLATTTLALGSYPFARNRILAFPPSHTSVQDACRLQPPASVATDILVVCGEELANALLFSHPMTDRVDVLVRASSTCAGRVVRTSRSRLHLPGSPWEVANGIYLWLPMLDRGGGLGRSTASLAWPQKGLDLDGPV